MLHIDLPTRTEIQALGEHRGWHSVSIVLRTTPLSQEAQADRIGLRNLLRAALAQAEAAGAGVRDLRALREPVEALAEDAVFWAEQAHSLALFASPRGGLRSFRLANRLSDQVEVSDRFHLKPLLRAVTFPHHAWVLAIGTGGARLVEVLADLPPAEARVPGLPRSMADAAGRRSHVERKGDMASGLATSESALLAHYVRRVDQALRPLLAGREVPLVLAATEPVASAFRSVCGYPHLVAEGIAGSPGDTPDHVLAAGARRVLDGLYAEEIKALRETYALRAGQGRATGDLAQAARAATFGAIDTLLMDLDAEVPGTVNEDGAVAFAARADARSYAVTDEIARRALRTGARVVAARRCDIPGGGALAAILRYPV